MADIVFREVLRDEDLSVREMHACISSRFSDYETLEDCQTVLVLRVHMTALEMVMI